MTVIAPADAKLVRIVWTDPSDRAAWQHVDDVAEWANDGSYVCESVGWLIYEDDETVIVAARRSVVDQAAVGLSMRVPRAVVRSIDEIAGPDTC